MKIKFNAESRGEAVSKLRKEPAFRTLMHAEDIVLKSIKTSEVAPTGSRINDTKSFHYFHLMVEINGQILDAWFNVRQPLRGQPNEGIFYEFGLDLQNKVTQTSPGLGPVNNAQQTNAPMSGPQFTIGSFLQFIKNKLSGQKQ